MKRNNKGFTLVELLAVIVVLSIVLGLTTYIAVNAINKAREKSYQVTINNIEKNAGNFLLENSDRLFFRSNDDDNEHQCVTVQDLIDFGYLKNDVTESPVAKDKHVEVTDYVYLERDATSKAIIKAVYTNNGELFESCGRDVIATADIALLITPNTEWSKEKEITITYKLKNITDATELTKYTYSYAYDGEYTVISDDSTIKKIKVTSEGKLTAEIKYNEEQKANKEKDITGIDRVGPTIDLDEYPEGPVSKTVTIPLVANDTQSGVDTASFTKEDLIITIDTTQIPASNYTLTHKTGDNYELKITDNDSLYEGDLTIKIEKDKVFDKVGNGNIGETIILDITFVPSVPSNPEPTDSSEGNNCYLYACDTTNGTWEYQATLITSENNCQNNICQNGECAAVWNDPTPPATGCSITDTPSPAPTTTPAYDPGEPPYPANSKCTWEISSLVATIYCGSYNMGITKYKAKCGGQYKENTYNCSDPDVTNSYVKRCEGICYVNCTDGRISWRTMHEVSAISCPTPTRPPIMAPCCETKPNGEYVQYNTDSECQRADDHNARVSAGACPTPTPASTPTPCNVRALSTCTSDGMCEIRNGKCADKSSATPTPSCGANQYWNETSKKCVCVSGYTMTNGNCVKNSTPTPTSSPKPSCFLAGTKVLTKNGYVDIDKIKVGNYVLSYNEKKQKNEFKKVTKVYVHKNSTAQLYTLSIDDKELQLTGEHKIYIKSGNKTYWSGASQVKVGDYVRYSDGTYHMIVNITHKEIKANFYNIEVKGNHNYYVGKDSILVHNAKVTNT